jgi:LuxR family transcriptional regulator, quorum-sensing system regulator BjaR1
MGAVLEQTYDVITRLNRALTPQEICDGLTNFTSRFGLTSMIAGTMPSPRDRGPDQEQHLLVSAFPTEWMSRYLENEYVHVDPVIKRIQTDLTPFAWAEAEAYGDRNNIAASRRVFEEASEFKLHAGYSVPMLTLDGQIAAVSLGGEKIDIAPTAPGMISMVSSFAIARAIELRSREKERKAAGLTPREIECIRWAADGKSEWEISIILHVSEHTADKHLSNAIKKLKAANRSQAVAMAIRQGLIS